MDTNNQNNFNFSSNESVSQESISNGDSSNVNLQDKKRNNKVIIKVVVMFIILLVVLALVFLLKPKVVKNVSTNKEPIKSIYVYKWIDKKYSGRNGIGITDNKNSLNANELTKDEILAEYKCMSDCSYYDGMFTTDQFAIYEDGKVYEYSLDNHKFREVHQTNSYTVQGYNFKTFDNWIVGSDANNYQIGYKSISVSSETVAASVSSLKTKSIANYKDGKLKIYNDKDLFYEKEISGSYITNFEKEDGYYLVLTDNGSLVLTDEKVELDVSLGNYEYSVHDGKFISIAKRTNIDVYDKSGALVSSTPYSSVAGVYENYSVVINNDEVQLINAISKDIIYNFGPKLASEILMNNYSYDLYVNYVNNDKEHSISVFLEDAEKRTYEPAESMDNMFGRKFVYDFNTKVGTISEASIYNEQNS